MMMMMMMMMMQYKTEKDGVIETRIEKRLVITGTAADVDHDKVNNTTTNFIASLAYLLYLLNALSVKMRSAYADSACDVLQRFFCHWRDV